MTSHELVSEVLLLGSTVTLPNRRRLLARVELIR